jgi:ubiquinone/menaquinone biosynthesis C-methylase UbiE
MTTRATTFDQERAEAFGGRVLGMLNDAFLTIGLSIGHQAGLFDTLAALEPATSDEVAARAGLNERYVREWLSAMTVGRIVEYDPTTRRFWLPAEHAASLTRPAGPGNLAATAQFLALLAPVEPEIVEAFRNGGGVGYDRFPGFARLMREDSANVFDAALIDVIVPLVPGMGEALARGASLADIGCGAGHAINLLARAFPKSTFTGYDISEEALAIGEGEAAAWGLHNTRFVRQDVATLAADAEFDFVTAFDAIHDQAQPRAVLRAVQRALKPGGAFLMADIAASSNLEDNLDHPFAPFGYTVSYLHCMTVSLAAGGEGLGTMWGEEKARELLAEAGFRDVEVRQAEGDVFNNYYVARK